MLKNLNQNETMTNTLVISEAITNLLINEIIPKNLIRNKTIVTELDLDEINAIYPHYQPRSC